ncbi:MAG: hypothetical protein CL503_02175 [Actinobacteria bacterium]|nr:hypothetical protein [Actinomycetota bacterium]|tara:strand:+ start:1178 stop:2398 length:1221 start_codon:yes stop_codon:yes gene_type:complete
MDTIVARPYSSYKPNSYSSTNRLPRNTENNMHNSHAKLPPKANCYPEPYIYHSDLSKSVKSNQSSDSIESNESASTAGVPRDPEDDSTVNDEVNETNIKKDGINSVNIQEELQAGRERVEFEKKNSLDGRSDDQVSGTRRLEEQGCFNFVSEFIYSLQRPIPPIEMVSQKSLNDNFDSGILSSSKDHEANKGNETENLTRNKRVHRSIEKKMKVLKAIDEKRGNFSNPEVLIDLGGVERIITKIKNIRNKWIDDANELDVGIRNCKAREAAAQLKEDFIVNETECYMNMREAVKEFRDIPLKDKIEFGEDDLYFIDNFIKKLKDFNSKLDGASFSNGLDKIKKIHVELVEIIKEKYTKIKEPVSNLYEREFQLYKKEFEKVPREQGGEQNRVQDLQKSESCPEFGY